MPIVTTNRFAIPSLLCVALISAAATVQASAGVTGVSNFLHVDGSLRLYDFNKEYGAPSKPDQRSSAVGGIVNITTSPILGGFGLGLSLFNTNALESFPAGDNAQEATLMGSRSSITTVGEAFAQFARYGAMLRAGRQLINTPWMGARDSRMLPQTFEGVWGQYTPIKGLRLMVTRVDAFKSRTSDGFYHDNLYYPNGYEGDQLYGTTTVFPKKAVLPEASGTFAIGAHYVAGPAHAQAWYYNFYDFARTAYVDGGYTFGSKTQGFQPYIDAQYMHQTGGEVLRQYKATLYGKGGAVNSTLWGVRGGVKFGGNNVSLAYNKLEDHADSFGGGALISPYGDYTAMYAAVMTANLLGYGPGNATELAWTRWFLDKQVKFKAAALKFNTTYGGNPHAVYLDASYYFNGKLKGLSIGDRLAVSNGAASAAYRSLVYNRLMLQYRF